MAKRTEPVRRSGERKRPGRDNPTSRRSGEAAPRGRRSTREQRPQRAKGSAPATSPIPRPNEAPGRPKNAAQAKARSKARKAKAPKVVRPPLRVRLRERILVKLSTIELNPRELVSRVPFVVLVIGALGIGLAVTLWLSTDAAERSYQLGHARQTNQALLQQKEALERDVLEAQAAPALAESARQLGMIPSRDTAHLVQDPAGAWVVVGTPKPAEGVSPPPLNSPLPEAAPPVPPAAPGPRVVEPREQVVRLPGRPAQPNSEVPVPGGVLAAPDTAGVPAAPAAPAAPGAPLAAAAPPAPALPEAPAPPPAHAVPEHGVPTLPGPAVPGAEMPATDVAPLAAPLAPEAGHIASPLTPTLPGPSSEQPVLVAPPAPGVPE
jgi:hypothetical protein